VKPYDQPDCRVFRTVKARIMFALIVGLIQAFVCGGWLPLVEVNARKWEYAPWFVLYWFCCAGMLFALSWLLDHA
jgi:xanthine/uracil permease